MTLRSAAMSSAAATLYQELRDAGLVIPSRQSLSTYRAALLDDSAAAIEKAIQAFDGVIEMIDVNGIGCRQLTPRGWLLAQRRCQGRRSLWPLRDA